MCYAYTAAFTAAAASLPRVSRTILRAHSPHVRAHNRVPVPRVREMHCSFGMCIAPKGVAMRNLRNDSLSREFMQTAVPARERDTFDLGYSTRVSTLTLRHL